MNEIFGKPVVVAKTGGKRRGAVDRFWHGGRDVSPPIERAALAAAEQHGRALQAAMATAQVALYTWSRTPVIFFEM
jgi:molybdenum-dependent DNA-binding transcriptional regulator ModE